MSDATVRRGGARYKYPTGKDVRPVIGWIFAVVALVARLLAYRIALF